MIPYHKSFPADLQEAAEYAGKKFDPAAKTEEEIQQLFELWMKWNGYELRVFAREFL